MSALKNVASSLLSYCPALLTQPSLPAAAAAIFDEHRSRIEKLKEETFDDLFRLFLQRHSTQSKAAVQVSLAQEERLLWLQEGGLDELMTAWFPPEEKPDWDPKKILISSVVSERYLRRLKKREPMFVQRGRQLVRIDGRAIASTIECTLTLLHPSDIPEPDLERDKNLIFCSFDLIVKALGQIEECQIEIIKQIEVKRIAGRRATRHEPALPHPDLPETLQQAQTVHQKQGSAAHAALAALSANTSQPLPLSNNDRLLKMQLRHLEPTLRSYAQHTDGLQKLRAALDELSGSAGDSLSPAQERLGIELAKRSEQLMGDSESQNLQEVVWELAEFLLQIGLGSRFRVRSIPPLG